MERVLTKTTETKTFDQLFDYNIERWTQSTIFRNALAASALI